MPYIFKTYMVCVFLTTTNLPRQEKYGLNINFDFLYNDS